MKEDEESLSFGAGVDDEKVPSSSDTFITRFRFHQDYLIQGKLDAINIVFLRANDLLAVGARSYAGCH